jgi:hypothetical protein
MVPPEDAPKLLEGFGVKPSSPPKVPTWRRVGSAVAAGALPVDAEEGGGANRSPPASAPPTPTAWGASEE